MLKMMPIVVGLLFGICWAVACCGFILQQILDELRKQGIREKTQVEQKDDECSG